MNFVQRCRYYWNLGVHGISPEKARWIAGNGNAEGSFLASWEMAGSPLQGPQGERWPLRAMRPLEA